MVTVRTAVYKLKPNATQERLMNLTCEAVGKTYNYLLMRCNELEKDNKPIPSGYALSGMAVEFRNQNEWMGELYAHCVSESAIRLRKAYDAYYRRIKEKKVPGHPKYKLDCEMNSFTYVDPKAFRFAKDSDGLNSLRFIKFGKIGFVKYHNPFKIPGKICCATIVRRIEGSRYSWYCYMSYELDSFEYVEESLEGSKKEPLGMDLGLGTKAALSDGRMIESDHTYQRLEKELAKQHRKLSQLEKGSPEYEKQRARIAHIYKKLRNKRHTFEHTTSRELALGASAIIVEDLSPKEMISKSYSKERRKEFCDASWGSFLNKVRYKSEDAGIPVISVNPSFTSQECFNCGTMVPKPQTERVHNCPVCGLVCDRDFNASQNILKRGMAKMSEGDN